MDRRANESVPEAGRVGKWPVIGESDRAQLGAELVAMIEDARHENDDHVRGLAIGTRHRIANAEDERARRRWELVAFHVQAELSAREHGVWVSKIEDPAAYYRSLRRRPRRAGTRRSPRSPRRPATKSAPRSTASGSDPPPSEPPPPRPGRDRDGGPDA